MKHLNSVLSLLIVALFATGVYAQSKWENLKLESLEKAVGKEVNFLETYPIIDGKLDENLNYLPIRYFCLAAKKTDDKLIPINFRMAYGTSFYIYI